MKYLKIPVVSSVFGGAVPSQQKSQNTLLLWGTAGLISRKSNVFTLHSADLSQTPNHC
ncbi:hypothetical protein AciX8_1916 [Granulicella mallensis MP5ACTX8]|uniref:Uncharacterized protein n=1 Tax=Granulicella mallensis (strain ATCC BAA-1857 / DSM 23137 / MP5ACTX8) TaxID=682795 RepID=G8NS44_GRAMM|nr:hypothetical protein AciX8_1916 [Granulicella mallensis MP5ACTX8]